MGQRRERARRGREQEGMKAGGVLEVCEANGGKCTMQWGATPLRSASPFRCPSSCSRSVQACPSSPQRSPPRSICSRRGQCAHPTARGVRGTPNEEPRVGRLNSQPFAEPGRGASSWRLNPQPFAGPGRGASSWAAVGHLKSQPSALQRAASHTRIPSPAKRVHSTVQLPMLNCDFS